MVTIIGRPPPLLPTLTIPPPLSAWGAPEDSELKITSDTISASMIGVEVVLLSRESEQLKTLQRRLPLTMRLPKLKVLVNKLFRGNIKELQLSYRSPQVRSTGLFTLS